MIRALEIWEILRKRGRLEVERERCNGLRSLEPILGGRLRKQPQGSWGCSVGLDGGRRREISQGRSSDRRCGEQWGSRGGSSENWGEATRVWGYLGGCESLRWRPDPRRMP